MMTFEMLMDMLAALGDDVTVDVDDDCVSVVVEDFAGFSADWDELDRDYDVAAVRSLLDMLAQVEHSFDGWETTYFVDGYSVTVHFASEDI